MAQRISDSWLDELRSRLNIADVISEYVPLKQKGNRYWGLCPFHGEKTASFSVSPDQQMFYCFGCHKGGNIIHFVMEYERMEFMEAVSLLAERAHMPLPDRTQADDFGARALRDQIYEANREAARYYHEALWAPEGAGALNYLYKRGLDDAGIRRFGLGSTPHTGDGLTRHLTQLGFDIQTLSAAGLSREKDGRQYDVFRDRVIFPIINPQGRVLGFGGRAAGGAQPKYLNTSDTPVFNKRNTLYALNMVKKERNLDHLLLVEGYMDVVSLRSQNLSGVVATLGTALTPEQARLIKNHARGVWICYDGDSAGQKAALRALDILDAVDVQVRVLDIPDGMDPDDYIRTHGAEAFRALKPLTPVAYKMLREADGADLTTQEGRTQYAINCSNLLKTVKNPVELENYIAKLSVQTGFDREVLMRQIGTGLSRQPDGRANYAVPRPYRPPPETDYQKAEKTLLNFLADGLIEHDPGIISLFVSPLIIKLAARLNDGETRASILNDLPDEERSEAARIFSAELNTATDKIDAAAQDCVATIRRHRLNERINRVQESIHNETDPEKTRELIKLFMALNDELSKTATARKE